MIHAMSFDMEIWRKIPEFSNYSVSNLGRIRRDVGGPGARVGRILKFNRLSSGHLQVQLYRDNIPHSIGVHRLVALAFIGPQPAPGMEVAHYDGNPQHNTDGNLRWATKAENTQDSIRHGSHRIGERCAHSKLKEADVVEIRRKRRAGTLLSDLATQYGVKFTTISSIVNGYSWKHIP